MLSGDQIVTFATRRLLDPVIATDVSQSSQTPPKQDVGSGPRAPAMCTGLVTPSTRRSGQERVTHVLGTNGYLCVPNEQVLGIDFIGAPGRMKPGTYMSL